MTNVERVFTDCIVPNSSKIKAITAPLRECLDIPYFCYGSVEADGLIFGLGNCPEIIESYHQTKAYLVDPHISHPHLLRSGSLFIPDAFGTQYMKPVCETAKTDHILMILQCSGDRAECFHFGFNAEVKNAEAHFLNHLDLLYHFIKYFRREAKPMIERERKKGFNIKETRGATFTENDFSSPLLKKDPKIQKFLKLMTPLTAREIQCLELFKQGKSAQMTGAILGLSQRTVESYFENIKTKLGCSSKADLLEW